MSEPIMVNRVPAAELAELPPEALAFVEEMGYLEGDRLKSGDYVLPMTVFALDGSGKVEIGGQATHPTVLIFASYT